MNKKRKIANKLKATNDPLANTQLDNTLNKYTGYTEQELYSSLQSKFVLDDTVTGNIAHCTPID
jgi:hypothetical protein